MVEGLRGGWESPSYASRSTQLPPTSLKDRPDVRSLEDCRGTALCLAFQSGWPAWRKASYDGLDSGSASSLANSTFLCGPTWPLVALGPRAGG